MENFLNMTSLDTSRNHEREDLSYRLIEGIDFQNASFKCSFYRSDFRGTQFKSDIFHKNSFDLADFIGNIFQYVEFYSVDFGNSEFKNCFLRNCIFENNRYNDIAVHGCTFSRCTFQNETFRMTMLDCKFTDCSFISCVFDQCTTDTLTFQGCIFLKCELSTMHAENFKFDSCTFRNAFLGTCFLGTYLFKNTDIDLISFKYRGEIVDTDSSQFRSLGDDLFAQRRLFEYFNLCILFRSDNLDQMAFCFPELIENIMREPNPNVRAYNLGGIFDAIEFYLGDENLPLIYVLRFFKMLQNYSLSHIPEEDRLLYLQRLYHLELSLSALNYSEAYIRQIPAGIPSIATIHCKDDSVHTARGFIERLFEYINAQYLDHTFSPPYFEIISCKKGSIVMTIASSLMILLMTAKVISQVSKSFCEIRIETAKTKRAIELISAAQSPASLQKAVSSVSAVPPTSNCPEAQKIFGDLGNSYLLDFIVHYFLK